MCLETFKEKDYFAINIARTITRGSRKEEVSDFRIKHFTAFIQELLKFILFVLL